MAARGRGVELGTAVLLAMAENEINSSFSSHFEDLAQLQEFEAEVARIRERAEAAPVNKPTESAVKLSGAVVAALTASGPPVEFPLEFLRRCTNGFDNESRLEGEGAFGKVRQAGAGRGIVLAASGVELAVHAGLHQYEVPNVP